MVDLLDNWQSDHWQLTPIIDDWQSDGRMLDNWRWSNGRHWTVDGPISDGERWWAVRKSRLRLRLRLGQFDRGTDFGPSDRQKERSHVKAWLKWFILNWSWGNNISGNSWHVMWCMELLGLFYNIKKMQKKSLNIFARNSPAQEKFS